MARVFVSDASAERRLAEQVLGWLTGDRYEVFFDADLHACSTWRRTPSAATKNWPATRS